MNKIGKKTKLLISYISILVISIFIITLLIHHTSIQNSFVQVFSKDMIISYEANYCHLDIYKQKDKIIINAYSDGKFDQPNQLIFPFEGEITKDNILVKWKTLGDKVVEQDSDSIIMVNLIIEKDGRKICDENINFFEKGWKILNDTIRK